MIWTIQHYNNEYDNYYTVSIAFHVFMALIWPFTDTEGRGDDREWVGVIGFHGWVSTWIREIFTAWSGKNLSKVLMDVEINWAVRGLILNF